MQLYDVFENLAAGNRAHYRRYNHHCYFNNNPALAAWPVGAL